MMRDIETILGLIKAEKYIEFGTMNQEEFKEESEKVLQSLVQIIEHSLFEPEERVKKISKKD